MSYNFYSNLVEGKLFYFGIKPFEWDWVGILGYTYILLHMFPNKFYIKKDFK